jgi:hypothetical protein
LSHDLGACIASSKTRRSAVDGFGDFPCSLHNVYTIAETKVSLQNYTDLLGLQRVAESCDSVWLKKKSFSTKLIAGTTYFDFKTDTLYLHHLDASAFSDLLKIHFDLRRISETENLNKAENVATNLKNFTLVLRHHRVRAQGKNRDSSLVFIELIDLHPALKDYRNTESQNPPF